MADLCVGIDCVSCSIGFCTGVEGDKRDPGCCKKTFLPMTSVIEAEGADKCCPEITCIDLQLLHYIYQIKIPLFPSH